MSGRNTGDDKLAKRAKRAEMATKKKRADEVMKKRAAMGPGDVSSDEEEEGFGATGSRIRSPFYPHLNPKTGINYGLKEEGFAPQLTKRTDDARDAHNKKWSAIYRAAKLTQVETGELNSVFDLENDCNPEDISELAQILGEVRLSGDGKGMGGGGKMVGGNPGQHLVKLLRWFGKLTTSAGASATYAAYGMSDCAVWFLQKIFDGLKRAAMFTGDATSSTLRALLDLAQAAAGDKDTVTVQLLVSICDSMYNGGVTVASAASSAASAAASAATKVGSLPYVNIFNDHVRNLLTTRKAELKAMMPTWMTDGITEDEFGHFVAGITIGQVANVVGIVVSAIKWHEVAVYGISLTAHVIYGLIDASVGALAVAANSYLATGAFLAVSVVLNLNPLSKAWLNEHLHKFDEALAAYITTKVDVPSDKNREDLMAAIAPLRDVPIARALALQTLKNKILQASLLVQEQEGSRIYISTLETMAAELEQLQSRIYATKSANEAAHSAVDAKLLSLKSTKQDTPPPTADAPPSELTVPPTAETIKMIEKVATVLFDNPLVGSNTSRLTAAGSSMDPDTFTPIGYKKIVANYGEGKVPGGKRSTQKRGKRRPKSTLRKATLRKATRPKSTLRNRASRNRKPYHTKRR